jgi:transcriptional regulator with XRE-family HTH domain
VSRDLADILKGLMGSRRLTPTAVSRASGRAESTIRQLLGGRIAPTAEILQDIAPVLEMPLADLLVIAGVETEPAPDRSSPYEATVEIGWLVAAASYLTPAQVRQLAVLARRLKAENLEERT